MKDNRVEVFSLLHDVVAHKLSQSDMDVTFLRSQADVRVDGIKNNVNAMIKAVDAGDITVNPSAYRQEIKKYQGTLDNVDVLGARARTDAKQAKIFFDTYTTVLDGVGDNMGDSVGIKYSVIDATRDAMRELQASIDDLNTVIEKAILKPFAVNKNDTLVKTAVKKRDEKVTELAATRAIYEKVQKSKNSEIDTLKQYAKLYSHLMTINTDMQQYADEIIEENKDKYVFEHEKQHFANEMAFAQARLVALTVEIKQRKKG